MTRYLQAFWRVIRQAITHWNEHNVSWMAAALAYYTLFSLAPTFIVVVTVGGIIFGEEAVKGEIVERLEGLIGFDSANAIQNMIEAGQAVSAGFFSKLFGVLIFLFAATNVFTHLRATLNKIWNVGENKRNWVANLLFERVLSIAMILSIGVLLLALVIVDIGLAGFDRILVEYVPAFTKMYSWQLLNIGVSFVIITLLFAAIYKILPETPIRWMDTWLGAAVASLIFTLGKTLIGFYLGSSRMISLFGAASSFIVVLVWVYLSVQILFLGAEIAQSYSVLYGSRRTKIEHG